MSFLQALFLAFVQGATELFPISSLGHAVILPQLLDWDINQRSREFLPFLVVLHLGTASALLLYFWRDWWRFTRSLLGYGSEVKKDRQILKLMVVATLPALILGFSLEHLFRGLFGSPKLAASFLIINGIILFLGERQATRKQIPLEKLDFGSALMIGVAQALALIPGISRSGTTMVAGLMTGLSHRDSARFSFFLATPIILGAGVLEVPKLFHRYYLPGLPDNVDNTSLVAGGIVSGIVAYLSVAFLMRYFKKSEIEALDPFAYYCCMAGGVALLLLTIFR